MKRASISAPAAGRPQPPGIIAVIKANAYGHGAARIARTLEEAGASWLAVADIEEGIELREAGARARILIFGALSVSDLAGVFEYDLTPTIASPAAGRALQKAAAARDARVPYHLKIDSGMHRLGFRHENLEWTIPELLASENLELEAVYTHFATADEPEHPLFDEQRTVFERRADAPRARRAVRGCATPPTARRCSAIRVSGTTSCVPGCLLHGVVPPPLATTIALAPVMSLTSRVVAVKGVRPGETVGYGGAIYRRAARRRWLSFPPVTPTASIDGSKIAASFSSAATARDRRRGQHGHADGRRHRHRRASTPATRWCSSARKATDSATIDAREMAAAVSTIPYEVLCRLGARVHRVYR